MDDEEAEDTVPVDPRDSTVRELLPRYLARRRADVERAREWLAGGDFEALRLLGHRLYGSGAAYGIEQISDLGCALEDAARHADGSRAAALVDELAELVERINIVE